jgi:uncharacterized membrane protein YgdD (TMEM256/DUF423 family)
MAHSLFARSGTPTTSFLRFSLVLGGAVGAAGVVFMALAAHADSSGLLSTAAEMMMFHAPVILLLGVLAQVRRSVFLPFALGLMIAGLALFCGDLLSRAFGETRLFPNAAPTGGMLLIVGWIAIVLSAIHLKPR